MVQKKHTMLSMVDTLIFFTELVLLDGVLKAIKVAVATKVSTTVMGLVVDRAVKVEAISLVSSMHQAHT